MDLLSFVVGAATGVVSSGAGAAAAYWLQSHRESENRQRQFGLDTLDEATRYGRLYADYLVASLDDAYRVNRPPSDGDVHSKEDAWLTAGDTLLHWEMSPLGQHESMKRMQKLEGTVRRLQSKSRSTTLPDEGYDDVLWKILGARSDYLDTARQERLRLLK